jgi:hypothetical protein
MEFCRAHYSYNQTRPIFVPHTGGPKIYDEEASRGETAGTESFVALCNTDGKSMQGIRKWINILAPKFGI